MRKSEDVQRLIIRDREAGKTYQQIAATYEISIPGAFKTCQKYQNTGSVKSLHGGGRKPKITEHQERLMKRKINAVPSASALELKECLKIEASVWTVRRKLRSMGLKNFVPKKRPMISKKKPGQKDAICKKAFEYASIILGWNNLVG